MADSSGTSGPTARGGQPVDLVYNRLVDFSLGRPEHQALRAAYLDGAVVVTPNPRVHALYADKRNLALLSDHAALPAWGPRRQMLADLAGVPHTVLVTSDNAQQLWEARKSLFFKPAGGYGSKAVYRGDKVTKGVWAEIIAADMSPRNSPHRVSAWSSWMALRRPAKPTSGYTYTMVRCLLTAARLYQGQTTNFRTPGGGFAPVFVI